MSYCNIYEMKRAIKWSVASFQQLKGQARPRYILQLWQDGHKDAHDAGAHMLSIAPIRPFPLHISFLNQLLASSCSSFIPTPVILNWQHVARMHPAGNAIVNVPAEAMQCMLVAILSAKHLMLGRE